VAVDVVVGSCSSGLLRSFGKESNFQILYNRIGPKRICRDRSYRRGHMHFGIEVLWRPSTEIERSSAQGVSKPAEHDIRFPRQTPGFEQGLPIQPLLREQLQG